MNENMTYWRWVDQRGRAMTHWKAGDPPPMRELTDAGGTMRVETSTKKPGTKAG